MLRRILFGSDRESDSPAVPSIIITVPVQPETALQRSLRRTAAVSNLASLVDEPEAAMVEPCTDSSATIIHRLAAVTVSETPVEHRAASSYLSMKKGYELEDNSCLSAHHLVYFDDAEESSSDIDFTPSTKLAAPAPARRLSNSTDPDSLDKIWYGRVSP